MKGRFSAFLDLPLLDMPRGISWHDSLVGERERKDISSSILDSQALGRKGVRSMNEVGRINLFLTSPRLVLTQFLAFVKVGFDVAYRMVEGAVYRSSL